MAAGRRRYNLLRMLRRQRSGVDGVNRADWRKLAEERVRDAKVLLDGGQWAAAYDLAGYAIECGLKSCVLAYVEKNADIIYREKRYSENCWTHDIGALVKASGLDVIRLAEANANPAFGVNWGHVQKWSETMRYQFAPESDAKRLYDAITHHVDGVLPWIRNHW
jgi:HEPN domain-containing protein